MSRRRIHVCVSPQGDVTVEADGFEGSGCEAATHAIESALGQAKQRTRKPQFWKRPQQRIEHNHQPLGGDPG